MEVFLAHTIYIGDAAGHGAKHHGSCIQNKIFALQTQYNAAREFLGVAGTGLPAEREDGDDAYNASNNDELMTFKKLRVVLGPCLLGFDKTQDMKLDVQPKTEPARTELETNGNAIFSRSSCRGNAHEHVVVG
ncbi:hypothetical protein MMC29_004914, partial [Sticta canariensis]|nr:hypothetical protein [Sticta canariensis]